MAEESLIETTETTEEPIEDTVEPSEGSKYFLADGVEVEGDLPDWFDNGKYKNVSEQAKGYSELASKFGGFTGSPETYEVKAPEDFKGEMIPDDPLIESFQEVAKDLNMSQDGFDKVLSWWLNTEMDNIETSRTTELETIDKDPAKRSHRIESIQQWGKANLDEDMYGKMESIITSADTFHVVEALINKSRPDKVPTNIVSSQGGVTKAQLDARIADPKYQQSDDIGAAFRKETSTLFEQFYGTEPANEVVQ